MCLWEGSEEEEDEEESGGERGRWSSSSVRSVGWEGRGLTDAVGFGGGMAERVMVISWVWIREGVVVMDMVMKVVMTGRGGIEGVGRVVGMMVDVSVEVRGVMMLLVLRIVVRSVLVTVFVGVCGVEITVSVWMVVVVGIVLDGMQDVKLLIRMGKLQDMLDFLEKN